MLTREQIEELADGALAMHEQLGRDVLSLVEAMRMPEWHAEKTGVSCALARP